jgi:hypothetical protein
MSFNAPKPPDPSQTAATQQQYNVQSATEQNKANAYNQSNPYGSMSYVADPNSPSGYTLQTNYSPTQQGLYNTQAGTQGIAGQTAQDLLKNTASMYSQAPDISKGTQGIASYLNNMQQQYLQPIFNQQQSNLEAQLRNQGLTPGSEAYNNAKNLQARNQGDVTNQYLTNNEGQAFNQAVQQYQLPLQTIGSLYGASLPTGPTFQNTPTAQIQPANYQGAAQNAYQGQLQNYQNTWSNLGKLGTAAIGLAGAPFTGGLSLGLAGGLGSMFGGTPGPMTYGTSQGPTAFYGG